MKLLNRRGLLTALLMMLFPAVSHAHAPIDNLGNFYNGVLHPILVPSHFLLISALGLYLGQCDMKKYKSGFVAFCVAQVIGLFIAYFSGIFYIEAWFLAGAIMLGGLTAAKYTLPKFMFPIIGFAVGLATGVDSRLETLENMDLILALMGVAIGVLLLTLYSFGLGDYLRKGPQWKIILSRILGSWIVAASGLVITFHFVSAPAV